MVRKDLATTHPPWDPDRDAEDGYGGDGKDKYNRRERGARYLASGGAANARAISREIAAMTMLRLRQLVMLDDLTVAQLLAIWDRAADQAGWLGGKDLAAAEVSRWRLAFEALAQPNLTPAQREKILAEVRAREAEALGETGER